MKKSNVRKRQGVIWRRTVGYVHNFLKYLVFYLEIVYYLRLFCHLLKVAYFADVAIVGVFKDTPFQWRRVVFFFCGAEKKNDQPVFNCRWSNCPYSSCARSNCLCSSCLCSSCLCSNCLCLSCLFSSCFCLSCFCSNCLSLTCLFSSCWWSSCLCSA